VAALTLVISSVFLACSVYLGRATTTIWGRVAWVVLVGGGALVRRARGQTA
jgi:hypothetical protein